MYTSVQSCLMILIYEQQLKFINNLCRYSNNNNYLKWQLLHGRSFVFAGFNIANVLNTFSSSYAIGYHFMHSPDGGGYTNGHFIGIGKINN